jgi:hypothetical protein
MAFEPHRPDSGEVSTPHPADGGSNEREQNPKRPMLEGEDLENLIKRLIGYAAALLEHRGRSWRANASSGPPGAVGPEDVVQTAILKYLSGQRQRPSGLALDRFLAQVVRSEISHLADNAENQKKHFFLADGVGLGLFPVAALAGDAYATSDDRLIAEKILLRVHAAFPEDEQFMQYTRLLLRREYDDSEGLARALGVTVAGAGNLRRRFIRFLARLRREGGY